MYASYNGVCSWGIFENFVLKVILQHVSLLLTAVKLQKKLGEQDVLVAPLIILLGSNCCPCPPPVSAPMVQKIISYFDRHIGIVLFLNNKSSVTYYAYKHFLPLLLLVFEVLRANYTWRNLSDWWRQARVLALVAVNEYWCQINCLQCQNRPFVFARHWQSTMFVEARIIY